MKVSIANPSAPSGSLEDTMLFSAPFPRIVSFGTGSFDSGPSLTHLITILSTVFRMFGMENVRHIGSPLP